jgi:hypothetical protein
VIASISLAGPAFKHSSGIGSAVLPLAVILSMVGMVDTARNMRERWDFYHAGVLLMLYADLMTIAMLIFMTICSWVVPLPK